ncbi:hypothetical protein [Synechococcus sp. WC10meta]|uniref:hypothetical protein n=1 Tax=Synechococcus sp. WC10meta TaxID=2964537 RepID=UPI0039C05AF3
MSEAGITRAAWIVAALVASAALGPWLALPLAGMVALGIVEQVAFGGRLLGLLGALLDWASPAYRQRVIRHEAGHILVAHLLGIPLRGYVLSPWQAFRRGIPGYGGVELDPAPMHTWEAQGGLSWADLERYGLFWMAGAAAESLHYGQVVGDEEDRQQLAKLLSGIRAAPPLASAAQVRVQMNRFLRQSRALLQAHPEAYAVAVQHLERGSPLQDCLAAIAASLEERRQQAPPPSFGTAC